MNDRTRANFLGSRITIRTPRGMQALRVRRMWVTRVPPTKSMVKTMAPRVTEVPKSGSLRIRAIKRPATSMWGKKPMAKYFIFSCFRDRE